MATEEYGISKPNLPQWKKDLLMRRRAVGQVLPTGSSSEPFTCPSVVATVRLAEYSHESNFLRRCKSEREQTGGNKNMKFIEQVDSSNDFVERSVLLGIKEIITKIESRANNKEQKMGEEKNEKIKNNLVTVVDNKYNPLGSVEEDNASDSSEEFKYGPGFVSKLKSKYLSLTLRQNQEWFRPQLDSLRRATSLENILDESERSGDSKSNYLKNTKPSVCGAASQRCRGLLRTNRDSMKRARSVEVLTRYDKSAASSRRSLGDTDISPENKNVRNRLNFLNVEEKELPPPDLVKHTLKIFETSPNSKNVYRMQKKNQKNVSDSNSAKKPVLSLKSSFVPKQSSLGNPIKFPQEITNGSVIDIPNKKFSDKSLIKPTENSTDKSFLNSSALEITDTIEKRKAALLKEKITGSVIEKVIINENQSAISKDENKSCDELSVDLPDFTLSNNFKQKQLPVTSPKANSNRDIIPEPPESKRSISPVLVKAPPLILSKELNTNTLSQNMKQVGVIRPIVTNKLVQSSLVIPNVNKSQLTDREIEKNLINAVKNVEQPVTKVIVSLKKSPEECLANDSTKGSEPIKNGQFWDKKPNTMVFNFSDRTTVPDYIENDGLILANRKEKPKVSVYLCSKLYNCINFYSAQVFP